MLPKGFVPDERTTRTLWRVDEGFDVSPQDAMPLVTARFLRIVSTPTARSGYELTDLGEEALHRAPGWQPSHD